MTDEYYMKLALNEAREAFDKDEVPVGAILVIDDTIIARGHNMTEHLTDVTAHAEMLALTAAFNYLGSKYLPQATLYVNLEPCIMCAGALYWGKLGRLVFGAEDPKNGCFHQLAGAPPHPNWPLHPKTLVTKGISADESLLMLKTFFKNKRA